MINLFILSMIMKSLSLPLVNCFNDQSSFLIKVFKNVHDTKIYLFLCIVDKRLCGEPILKELLNMSASKTVDSSDEDSETEDEEEDSSTPSNDDSPEDEELRELTLKLEKMKKEKEKESKRKKKLAEKKEMIKKLIEEENRKHNKSDKSSKPKTSKPRKSKPIEETDGDAFEHRYNEKKISKKQRRADYKTHNSSQDDSAEEEDSTEESRLQQKNRKREKASSEDKFEKTTSVKKTSRGNIGMTKLSKDNISGKPKSRLLAKEHRTSDDDDEHQLYMAKTTLRDKEKRQKKKSKVHYDDSISEDDVTFQSKKKTIEKKTSVVPVDDQSDDSPNEEETINLTFNDNDDIDKFISNIGLDIYFPGKLQLMDVMKIESNVKPVRFDEIALKFIHNLVMINFTCRDKMVHDQIEVLRREKLEVTEDESNEADYLDDLLGCDIKDDNSFVINPLDLLVASFHCSSPMLKQILASKLFMCKLAVPLVLPNQKLEKMKVSLWPLRSVLIESKTDAQSCQTMSVDTPCHIVSFIRFGRPTVSKSKLINELLVDQYHNTFFNKDCPLGTSPRSISNGLIEAAWYLPSSKSSLFENVTMFLNLRGQGEFFQEQTELLSQISTVVVVMLDINLLDDPTIENQLRVLHTAGSGMILAIDAITESKNSVKRKLQKYFDSFEKKATIPKVSILTVDRQMRSVSVIKLDIRNGIGDLVHNVPVESIWRMLKSKVYLIDEDEKCYKTPGDLALSVMKKIPKSSSAVKDDVVPLQGKLWRTWSEKLKNVNKASEHKTLQELGTIRDEMKNERIQQLQICENLRPLMKLFLFNLAELISSDHDCIVFVLWLKQYLDDRSRNTLPKLLSKYQSDWQALKAARDKREMKDVDSMRKQLDQSEYNLAEASFGFEHLSREMGQLYEAVTECTTKKTDVHDLVQQLPIIAAKLLLLGHPYEVMDGDAANVPLTWVKAVLEQLKSIIGDKKLLALSVLGIQSSGKSTLLNTMFGLQFAVSAGRCTRGVFMQLVPVADTALAFDYLLVIDTEGLRAPELAHQKYNHDNELATFVIGLGDVTIVNIKGENTAEVQDVLQIAVHAFLRLKLANQRLNLKQSCVFAHQNVPASDANDKMMQGRKNFVDILDKMTKEAAEQENIAEIQSFNQVIEFDSDDNVWYFSDLWRGDPPMAPSNPGYSETVSNVKESIIFKIAAKRKTYLSITDTISRIEDLWTGILKDDFVFSFRNSLELKAYNSMERECQALTWTLEKSVLEFVRSEAKGSLMNCKDENELEGSVPTIVMRLAKEVDKILKELNEKLDHFIETNALKEVMIQWKQSKVNRFRLFADDLVMRGKTDVIKTKEEIRIQKLQQSEKTKHEMEINELARNLAVEMRGKRPSESLLKQKFDTIWTTWINKFAARDIMDTISIQDQIESMLCEKFPSDATYMQQITIVPHQKNYFEKRLEQLKDSISVNWVSIEKHISIKRVLGFMWKKENEENCKKQTIDVTNVILRKIDTKLSELKAIDCRFDLSYVTEILNIVISGVENHNLHANDDLKFNILPTFRAVIVLHVVRFVTVFFTNLDERYQKKHSPKAQMEAYRGTAWSLFTNLVKNKTDDVITLGFFKEAIITSVKEHVCSLLPIDVQENIMSQFSSGKYSLIKDILTELANNGSFAAIQIFISDPFNFAEKWIFSLTNKTIFHQNKQDKQDKTLYAKLARTRVSKIFSQLTSCISKTPKATKVSEWVVNFLKLNNETKGVPLSNDALIHVTNGSVSNIQSFTAMVLEEIDKIESEVMKSFDKESALSVIWKQNPVTNIMDKLWGCTENCMFCQEPCMNTDKNHVKDGHSHKCLQHRPEGMGGFKWSDSSKLVVDFCNHSVTSDCTYHKGSLSGKYKEYKTHFPDWDIAPNSDTSKYWMWIMCTYQNNLAEMYHCNLPDIPANWRSITKKEAIDSL